MLVVVGQSQFAAVAVVFVVDESDYYMIVYDVVDLVMDQNENCMIVALVFGGVGGVAVVGSVVFRPRFRRNHNHILHNCLHRRH